MQHFQLRDYQSKYHKINEERLTLLNQTCHINVLPTGGGKCLGKGTTVMKYDGTIVPVENIKVGDLLMGDDSTPRTVLSTCSGIEELYKVIPVKGDSWVCNKSHVLSLVSNSDDVRINGNTIYKNSVIDIQLNDYLNLNKTSKHCLKQYRAKVNSFENESLLPLDSWLFGVWLSDGSKTRLKSSFHLNNTNKICVADKIIEIIELDGFTWSFFQDKRSNAITLNIKKFSKGYFSDLITNIFQCDVSSKDLYIPHFYKTSSFDNRLKLLAGIIDGDGFYDGKNIDFSCVSKVFAEDVCFLARSLGFAAYIVERTTKADGKYFNSFRISISGDYSIIPSVRFKFSSRKQIKSVLRTGFKLESIGEGEYFGFELSGNGRFLLGDFTVTHNTALIIHQICNELLRGKRVLFLSHRKELIDNVLEIAKNILRVKVNSKGSKLFICNVLSYKSLQKRFNLNPGLINTIIIDECHHCMSKTYEDLLLFYKQHGTSIIGYTATPERLDRKPLKTIFDELIQLVTLRELIDKGWLCDYLIYKDEQSVDFFDNTSEKFNDYDQKDVLIKIKRFISNECVLDHYLTIPNGKAIGFSPNCEHAENITEYFNSKNIPTAYISSKTDKKVREKLLNDFKHNKLKCLWNVELFTEGVDVPDCNVLLNLRLTKSIVLWHQMIGRVVRKAKGKDIAHIFDFTKNWHDLPLPDHIQWSLTEPPKFKRKNERINIDMTIRKEIVTVNDVVFELKYEEEFLTASHKEELNLWIKIAEDTGHNREWILSKFESLPNYKNLRLKMINYIRKVQKENQLIAA